VLNLGLIEVRPVLTKNGPVFEVSIFGWGMLDH
jgi:hypothetical protein